MSLLPTLEFKDYLIKYTSISLITEIFSAYIKLEALKHITQKEEWIVSGNYFSRQNTIIQNADTVIYLKIGFVTRFYRALIRGVLRSIRNTPVCNGNYETLKQTFLSKDSLLLYIIFYFS